MGPTLDRTRQAEQTSRRRLMERTTDLSHADLAQSLRTEGLSTWHDHDPGMAPYLLDAAAALPQTAESLAALATARRSQQLVETALATLDEALVALADALER